MTRSRVRRLVCWALIAAGLPLVWACQSYHLSPPTPRPEQVLRNTVAINPTQQLDIVFMIDNSPSMEQEQTNLTRNFPLFMNELQAAVPQGLDVHIGIISSNLGVASGISRCTGTGDGGVFRNEPRAGACTAVPNGTFIIAGPAGNNFAGPIADVFSCIAPLGVEGCGFEHQLASVRRALGKDPSAPMPAQNNGFLRPNARLGIILITDEDDCSAPPDSDLFRSSDQLLSDPYGQQQSFRCNEFGHLCAGQPPRRMSGVTSTDCHSNETASSKLIHVSEFVADIKSLKANPDLIVVAAITGPTEPYVTRTRTAMPPNGTPDVLEISPSCVVPGSRPEEGAAPAVRIHEFVNAFGTNGIVRSICTPDFGTVMREIARTIAPAQNACVGRRLVDKDPALAGVQPDCEVTQTTPRGVDSPVVDVIRRCDATRSNVPCWVLQQNAAACPQTRAPESFEIKVERGGATAPADARLDYSCVVCAGTNDPRCP